MFGLVGGPAVDVDAEGIGNPDLDGSVSIFLRNLLFLTVRNPDPSFFISYCLKGRDFIIVPDLDHLPFSWIRTLEPGAMYGKVFACWL